MRWNHLPEEGGLYDQAPDFIDRVYYIMAEKARWEEQERARKDRETTRQTGGATRRPSMGGGGRRR